jgi:sugar phosphate isomerase/epimerase
MGSKFDNTVEHNAMLHNRNLIIPGLPKNYEASAAGWKAAAAVLNEIAMKLNPRGMRIGYHNHDVEFHDINGVLPWALLYGRTRPDVILQLDTGNARIAGADPASLIRQYPGRAVSVHVKDYLPGLWVIKNRLPSFTPLPTSGNDGEDRLAGMWTRFGFEGENAFRPVVRQEYFCSGQCAFGLDGSKQGSRAQVGEDDTHSTE